MAFIKLLLRSLGQLCSSFITCTWLICAESWLFVYFLGLSPCLSIYSCRWKSPSVHSFCLTYYHVRVAFGALWLLRARLSLALFSASFPYIYSRCSSSIRFTLEVFVLELCFVLGTHIKNKQCVRSLCPMVLGSRLSLTRWR